MPLPISLGLFIKVCPDMRSFLLPVLSPHLSFCLDSLCSQTLLRPVPIPRTALLSIMPRHHRRPWQSCVLSRFVVCRLSPLILWVSTGCFVAKSRSASSVIKSTQERTRVWRPRVLSGRQGKRSPNIALSLGCGGCIKRKSAPHLCAAASLNNQPPFYS